MGTQINFTPLLGALSKGPVSYLLNVDGLKVLLDCGWTDAYDAGPLEPVCEAAREADLVLLTHGDMEHLGALPYLAAQKALTAPVFATLPVARMGQMVMYDQQLAHQSASEFSMFDMDSVDAAFKQIHELKFHQIHRLQGKSQGFTLTALPAGHSVGGAIWQICTPAEESIIYAPDFNHQREAHLNAGALDSCNPRPAVLICGTKGHPIGAPPRLLRKDREARMLDLIRSTLRNSGSVLVPVETAGRLLEVLLVLAGAWESQNLPQPLVLLTHVALTVLELARSQLEWLADGLSKALAAARGPINPFTCRKVKIMHRVDELHSLRGPKVVLASQATLAAGPARALLQEFAYNPRNLVLWPVQPPTHSLAAEVVQLAGSRAVGAAVPSLRLRMGSRVPLDGEELQAWEAQQHAQLLQPMEPEDQEPAEAVSATPLQSRASTGSIARKSSMRASGDAVLPNAEQEEEADVEAEPQIAAGPDANPDVLLDGFKPPEGAQGPMFPNETDSEEELEWDKFGCPVRLDLANLADTYGHEYERVQQRNDSTTLPDTEAEPMEEDTAADVPTKVVSQEVEVVLRARVEVLDCDGRSDARSRLNLISHIAPRHLILIHGSAQDTHALRDACAAELPGGMASVHCPAVGQAVDASTGSSAFQAVMSEGVLESLRLKAIGGYQLAWLQGQLAPGTQKDAALEVLPGDMRRAGEAFVVDERLSEVAGALGRAGIATQWGANALLVYGGRVIVRRGQAGSNELLLHGNCGAEFYRVQEVVYQQTHVS